MKKLCPIPKHGEAWCNERECAWWCGKWDQEQGISLPDGECAMTRIAIVLHNIDEELAEIKNTLWERQGNSEF